MKSWKKNFKSAFSGYSLSDLTYGSWKSWKRSSSSGEVPEEIKSAYKSASDLVTVMNLPFKVELKLNADSAVRDDTRVLTLPTTVFDEKGWSEQDKVLISTGKAIHEAEHMVETDLQVIKGPIGDSFTKLMSSLIEDERIENKLLEERPGFMSHIQKVREYDVSKADWNKLGGLKNGDFFKELFTMTRSPELMDEGVYEKYKDTYDEILGLITAPLKSTEDSVETAKKVRTIVQKYLDEMSKKEQQDLMSLCRKEYGKDMESTQGDKGGFNDHFDRGEVISDKLGDEDVENDCRIIQGDSEYGTNKDVTFTKQPGDRVQYLAYKSEVSPYISAIKKLLMNVDKNYEFKVKGMRSGVLDTNKIVEAYQGIPQVYVRKGTVSTNKTRVCILIDESGSMYYRCGTAAKAGILLKEAFGSIPGLELYIYGHSADQIRNGSTELYVYQEGSSYAPKYSLASITARDENRDPVAIDEVCARVRKFTDDHVIMFVISDGVPCAYECHERRPVKEVVKRREKQGFDIIQVNIGDDLGEREMKEMFDKYVYIKNSISEFPKVLGGIIKKAITADKSTKVQVL